MSPRELYWAAGFFDGEGSTFVVRTGRTQQNKYVRLRVNQTDPRPLERFHAAIGGIGKVNGPYSAGRHKPYWQWTATGDPGVRAAFRLLPALSEPKQEQIERVLQEAGVEY